MSIDKYELLNQERKIETKVQRVAAYCRVSTDNRDQANSFESQQKYFKEYIVTHPDWELCEIFADKGVSGTNTKKRREFLRMIECAKNGQIDMIITKEISRFARNTLDSIGYTRELKKYGVGVIFVLDNLDTRDPDAELRLTIMSSLAQDESRRTSERVKWGQKRRMEDGVVFGCNMLGYDVKDGKMTVNEKGAKIVRLIYHKCVNEGKGTHTIARELREEGIKPLRVQEWSNTVILRVLRNEKYCGDLVQKKTITPDYLTHEKKYNHGEEEFVIIKDHHEPIVSREMFEEANRILDGRSLSPEGKAKHSNRYPFSGKIKCGICGRSYAARYRSRQDGSKYKAWRCGEAAKHGSKHLDKAGNEVGCSSPSIRNEEAIHIMYLAVKNLKFNREKITSNLLKVIKSVLADSSLNSSTNRLQKKLDEMNGKRAKLLELYMESGITKEEFVTERKKIDSQISDIKMQMDSITNGNILKVQQEQLFCDIEKNIIELVNGMEYEDEFYKQILDKIVIIDKNTIDLYLNILPEKWRFTVSKTVAPTYKCITLETQVATEELAHFEMIGTMVHQLTRNLSEEDIRKAGFDGYFVDHTAGVYPVAASGFPNTAAQYQVKGDIITDLNEDLAAEQKARTTYDNILRFCDDPDVREPIKFLRQREIVHYQRFGEALRLTTDRLNYKNFYAFNPSFDKGCAAKAASSNC